MIGNRGWTVGQRLLLLAALVAIVALFGLWRPAVSGATCFRVQASDPLECFKTPTYKFMLLNVVLQGDYDFVRIQNGVDQNACGNASGTTPNSASEAYGFSFDVVWYHVKVPFAPVTGARPIKAYTSGKDTVSGHYDFSGSNYDANCNQVTWPAGGSGSGSSCDGHLSSTNNKLGLSFLNYRTPSARPDKNHVFIDMQPIPLDALTATPASCNDTDGQPHAFDELSGGESPDALVSLNVTNRSLGGRSFVHGAVALRGGHFNDPAGFLSDCSVPSAQLTCHEQWTGSAHVYVYRVGVIP